MKTKIRPRNYTDRRIQVYVRANDYLILESEAMEAGYKSLSGFLRRRIMGKGTIIQRPKEVLEALDRVGAEIGRIGNNINQMTKLAHMMEKEGNLREPTINRFAEELVNYHHALKELSRTYNTLLIHFDD
ncbi:MAG: plasmid mobilization relaxosome protein MobC [Cyclobacteriaceae bacterium]|nr:plasmid mobilization relaxosome protein MobC [Cyclobacteriaceae bacterium]